MLHNVDSLNHFKNQLTRAADTFLKFTTNPRENIKLLTALCGEQLKADCALYNNFEGNTLYTTAGWHTPADYNPVDMAEGHICYDVVKRGGDDVFVQRNLQQTHYAKTDPNVFRYQLQTYIGKAVKSDGKYAGTLCVVYKQDFIPSEEDKNIIIVIAGMIGIEETRQRARETIEASERKYRLLAENVSDIIFTMDMNLSFTYISPSISHLLGYSVNEAMALKIENFLKPADYQLAMKIFEESLAEEKAGIRDTPRIVTEEFESRHKNGSFVWLELKLSFLYSAEGIPVSVLGVARDIAERKKAEERLREQRDILDLIANDFPLNTTLELLASVVENSAEVVFCNIMQYVQKERKFYHYVTSGAPEEYIREMDILLLNQNFESDEKRYPKHGEKTLMSEMPDDFHLKGFCELAMKFGLKSCWYVPVLSLKQEILGFFTVYFHDESTTLNQDLKEFLTTCTHIAGIAFEREQIRTAWKMLYKELEEKVQKRTAELSETNIRLQQEIVFRKEAEKQLVNSLREKEVLLKEIHHRVKNNLQIIYSLLNLNSRQVKDEQTLNILRESQNRIKSIALVHEFFFRSAEMRKIDFSQYIKKLIDELKSVSKPGPLIKTEMENKQFFLDIDTAIPCGLILNELISNSLKYAFPTNKKGTITVKFLSEKTKGIKMIVEDDGIGFSRKNDNRFPETLGLQLVKALVNQINGTMDFSSKNGTSVTIIFPRE